MTSTFMDVYKSHFLYPFIHNYHIPYIHISTHTYIYWIIMHICKMDNYLAIKEEGNPAISHNMDEH